MIKKRTYAIIYAMQILDHYLNAVVFTNKSDNKPPQYLLESVFTNKNIQQCEMKLSGYNYKIEALAGSDDTCADLLSKIKKCLSQNP